MDIEEIYSKIKFEYNYMVKYNVPNQNLAHMILLLAEMIKQHETQSEVRG